MMNSFTYTKICDADENYVLSASINDDNKYDDPMFSFYIDSELTELWDNESYLVKKVISYLYDMIEDDYLDEYFSNVKEIVKEIFERGLKLGFFDKYLNLLFTDVKIFSKNNTYYSPIIIQKYPNKNRYFVYFKYSIEGSDILDSLISNDDATECIKMVENILKIKLNKNDIIYKF